MLSKMLSKIKLKIKKGNEIEIEIENKAKRQRRVVLAVLADTESVMQTCVPLKRGNSAK